MRYLILFLLFSFSSSVFASTPSCGSTQFWGCLGSADIERNRQSCVSGYANAFMVPRGGTCPLQGDTAFNCIRSCSCPSDRVLQAGQCVCPAGQSEYDAGSAKICGPSSCPTGEIINIRNPGSGFIAECIPDPDQNPEPEDPEDCPSGQVKNLETDACEPKVECEYPQLYDSYSNACRANPLECAIGATPNPLQPGTCMATGPTSCPPGWVLSADELNCLPSGNTSSAASSPPSSTPPTSSPPTSSTPTSSPPTSSPPTSQSNSSSGSGGDGDGSGNGGGTGGGTGGNNGGTASSVANSSGSNSSWTPNSAYGNWIPVDAGSNCPNKYQDNTGKWWCWGGQSSTGSSAGSGSNSSGSGIGGDDCESEPSCPMDDIQCVQLVQQWHTRCGGEKLDEKFWELPDKGDDKVTFEKSLKKFKEDLQKLPNTQSITKFFEFNGSGSCPVWAVSAWVFDIVIDQQCSPNVPWDLIRGIIIAVAVLVAARIALT